MIHRLANAEQGDYAEEGKLPDLFYEATITLIPKPDQIKKKERKKIMGQYHCQLQIGTYQEHCQ